MAQVFLYGLLAGTATVIGSLFVLYRAGGERKDLCGPDHLLRVEDDPCVIGF